MHILPQALLVVFQGSVGHLFDKPLDIPAILQQDGPGLLHVFYVLGGNFPHFQHLKDGLIVVLEKVGGIALHPVIGVHQGDNPLKVPYALLIVDIFNKGHVLPVVLHNIRKLQGAAVQAYKIPALGGSPELHLFDGVAVPVLGMDKPQGRHGGAVAGLVDHDTAAGGHLHKADHGVLIHVQHFKAAAVYAGGFGQLCIFVLLIVIVENVLQGLEESIVLAGIGHRLAQEVPHRRVRDIPGHIVHQPVIGHRLVLFGVPQDIMVSHIVPLQALVLGAALVFLYDFLDVPLGKPPQGRALHVKYRQTMHPLGTAWAGNGFPPAAA